MPTEIDVVHQCDLDIVRARERERIVEFGRAYLARKADSAFSTAHLANFLDAVERGEHLKASG